MIKKKKINQRDKRGYILDIFINKPKDHCTLVTFNKNSIRGNHYHKKSVQYSFIIEGKFLMITSKVDKNGKLKGRPLKKIVKQNDLITHKPFHAHAFKAKTKSIMLAFADGIRGGKNYEKDTFRLLKPLI
tara:strand:+ start:8809 stop:9198 length:390 start_codon:yes stop_codon:yes gene_type:complete